MSSVPHPFARLLDSRSGDQRAHRRYAIGLEVQYKLFDQGRVKQSGSGRTLNLSSGGVCFECTGTLPAEGSIELLMTWPLLLEGVCPLKLVMRGRIVRSECINSSDGRRVAVQAKHHEFRNAGIPASRVPAPSIGGRSLAR